MIRDHLRRTSLPLCAPATTLRTAALLTAMLLATSGCGDRRDAARVPGRNVVLVTMDTTRPDRIGAYGRPDARTPALDRLARQGAIVEWAIADVPVTLPSHTTILTGVPAVGHGVRYNADFRVTDDAETLAERFAELGYDTGAVISALVLDAKFGLDQGFAFFQDQLTPGYIKYDESLYPAETHWLPKADRRAEETVDLSLAWLDEARRPFLLWSHFYDPHYPFDPPPPWERTASELYLAEIQFTDRQIGRIVRRLEETGEMDSTVFAITADHGEGLDQHREDGHGIFVYDDTIHVPFLIRAPGAVPAAKVLGEQVRTIDVATTLLQAAGHPDETLGIGGTLLPVLNGQGDVPDPVAYSESIKSRLFYGGSGLKSLRTKDRKFIWAPRPELYALLDDPGETDDRARAAGDEVTALRDELEATLREIRSHGLVSVEAYEPDAETREALQSLGYVTGSGASAELPSVEEEMTLRGHDPKDLVDVSMGAREIQNGFYDSGERKLLRFFATARTPDRDPTTSRLWAAAHQNYAKIWMVRGDYGKAAEEYRRAAEADPQYDLARWSRIYALNLAGRADEAVREADVTLRAYPNSYRVMVHRGVALALLGRRDEAIEQFELIVRESEPQGTPTRNARYYLSKLGTPGERDALDGYLTSEAKRAGGAGDD
jgi:arylsulfatase A-like enzyme